MTARDRLRPYYADGLGGWFVIRCQTLRLARRAATEEFGRGCVKSVRRATDEDVRSYRVQHGAKEEEYDP